MVNKDKKGWVFDVLLVLILIFSIVGVYYSFDLESTPMLMVIRYVSTSVMTGTILAWVSKYIIRRALN